MKRILGIFRFGSGGHGHHHIKLSQSQNWITNESGKFIALSGFKDLNLHDHHDAVNPYQHLVDAPFFSFERFYWSDPYFHSDETDPLANQPHGYLIMDDPLQQSNNMEVPLYELMILFSAALGYIILYGHSYMLFNSKGEELVQTNITRGLIEDEIKKIREQTQALEDRKRELQEKLSNKQN